MIENITLDEIEQDYLDSLKEMKVLDNIYPYIDDIRKGDIELMKLLVNTYIVIVPSICAKYINEELRIAFLDLVEEANYTILDKTKEYFDNNLEEDFDTYIRYHIEKAIEDFIKNEDQYLYYNEQEMKILHEFVEFYENSIKNNGRVPTIEEVGERFKDIDVEKLRELMK